MGEVGGGLMGGGVNAGWYFVEEEFPEDRFTERGWFGWRISRKRIYGSTFNGRRELRQVDI